MRDFTSILEAVCTGHPLDADRASLAFAALADGEVPHVQAAGFLAALRVKEPTIVELTAAVREMRKRMVRVTSPPGTVDILGTGGDGKATFNVSTAAALVVASTGVYVAKQGNGAFSSRCGSADVLQEAGVRLTLTPTQLASCLTEVGFCFLYAPDHHPALRHVHEVRRGLGVRTVFNLMGPMMNAADVKRHLIGVFDQRWIVPVAETLGALGSERALVVSSSSGMDEIALDGPTHVAELDGGVVNEWTLDPRSLGVPAYRDEELRGASPAANASALRSTLEGADGPFRQATEVNAAAALYVAGKASTVAEGREIAAEALDEGAPARLLDHYSELTQSLGRSNRP
ncbi:anthranilate phosphoribosyltransferase [Kocuria indica]|uniref:Anthranilate phosphoribosyltransferase n=1 Tax=Kocuria marina subsp. indica TaxID=1049583 RepID=A0A6N9R0U5_9MICC|nr:anthranilate phosphoribosyltransferase [Kocuria indica]NDO79152.1 anthranilate phosphoribosyltransferase [Kocuria indica]